MLLFAVQHIFYSNLLMLSKQSNWLPQSYTIHNTQWLREQVMINITIMERVLSRDGTQHFSIKTLSQIYLFALEKCDSTMK